MVALALGGVSVFDERGTPVPAVQYRLCIAHRQVFQFPPFLHSEFSLNALLGYRMSRTASTSTYRNIVSNNALSEGIICAEIYLREGRAQPFREEGSGEVLGSQQRQERPPYREPHLPPPTRHMKDSQGQIPALA